MSWLVLKIKVILGNFGSNKNIAFIAKALRESGLAGTGSWRLLLHHPAASWGEIRPKLLIKQIYKTKIDKNNSCSSQLFILILKIILHEKILIVQNLLILRLSRLVQVMEMSKYLKVFVLVFGYTCGVVLSMH